MGKILNHRLIQRRPLGALITLELNDLVCNVLITKWFSKSKEKKASDCHALSALRKGRKKNAPPPTQSMPPTCHLSVAAFSFRLPGRGKTIPKLFMNK